MTPDNKNGVVAIKYTKFLTTTFSILPETVQTIISTDQFGKVVTSTMTAPQTTVAVVQTVESPISTPMTADYRSDSSLTVWGTGTIVIALSVSYIFFPCKKSCSVFSYSIFVP
jgi:hypothetical protein